MQNGSVYMKQSIRNLISHNSVKLARKNTHMTQSNDPKLQPLGKLFSFLCQYIFGYLPSKHLLRLHTTQCRLVSFGIRPPCRALCSIGPFQCKCKLRTWMWPIDAFVSCTCLKSRHVDITRTS